MLRRLMSWLDKNEGGVFGGFWFFFVMMTPFDVAEKHYAMDDPRFRGVVWGGMLLCALAGVIIWKILKRDRFSSIRNVVVSLQGLIFFPYFLGFSIIVPSFLIGYSFLTDFPFPLFIVTSVSCILIGLFLGGCFVGLKIRRLVPFWGILAAGWLYFLFASHPGITMAAALTAVLAVPVYGSHLGRRYSIAMDDAGGGDIEHAPAPAEQ